MGETLSRGEPRLPGGSHRNRALGCTTSQRIKGIRTGERAVRLAGHGIPRTALELVRLSSVFHRNLEISTLVIESWNGLSVAPVSCLENISDRRKIELRSSTRGTRDRGRSSLGGRDLFVESGYNEPVKIRRPLLSTMCAGYSYASQDRGFRERWLPRSENDMDGAYRWTNTCIYVQSGEVGCPHGWNI